MVVVRSDDPERARLEASGWRVVAESWAAALVLDHEALDRLRAIGVPEDIAVRELDAADVPAILALDAATARDYPGDVATAHPPLDDVRATPTPARRAFGAFDAATLVALGFVDVCGESAEIDFTVVAASHRRRGIATALKAASLLRLAADGVRVVRTGGSADNPGIAAANRRLGFVVDERWVTLRP